MKNITPDQPFSFEYPEFDQDGSLFVAGLVHEIIAGVPTLVATVPMAELENGTYSGNYTGSSGKRYLVICGVYSDAEFTVPADYAPEAECFNGNPVGSTALDFNFGAFDRTPTLLVAGNLYDVSSGVGVFVRQVAMTHVALGVYFGTTTGIDGKTYSLNKLVYSDEELTTPDLAWAPGADGFQCFVPAGVQEQIDDALRLAKPSIVVRLPHQTETRALLPLNRERRISVAFNEERRAGLPHQREIQVQSHDQEEGDC